MLSNKELKSLTRKELLEELTIARSTTMKKRITIKTKHDKDSSSAPKIKKYVARIMTAIKELDLEEMVKCSVQVN